MFVCEFSLKLAFSQPKAGKGETSKAAGGTIGGCLLCRRPPTAIIFLFCDSPVDSCNLVSQDAGEKHTDRSV